MSSLNLDKDQIESDATNNSFSIKNSILIILKDDTNDIDDICSIINKKFKNDNLSDAYKLTDIFKLRSSHILVNYNSNKLNFIYISHLIKEDNRISYIEYIDIEDIEDIDLKNFVSYVIS